MSGPGDNQWRGGRQPSQRQSRGMGGRSGQNNNNNMANNAWGDSCESSTGPAHDQHVPVWGFNAAEAKGALKRGPAGQKPFFYRPGKDNNNRSNSPWGSKPNTMANGKDFFLELRKQVTTLRQGGNVAGG